MQHHYYADAVFAVEALDEAHHLHLVGDIQIGSRLIQKEDLRLLGEYRGDPHALRFSARALVDGLFPQRPDAGGMHGPVDDLLVILAVARVPLLVRHAAIAHQLAHLKIRRRAVYLRQHADVAGQFFRGEVLDAAIVQPDRAALIVQKPRQALEHGGFARTVGADDTGDLALFHAQIHVGHGGVVAVGDFQFFSSDFHERFPSFATCRGRTARPSPP